MRRRPVPSAGASCHICIEPQQARPRQGGSSLFKLGLRCDLWRGVMATLQLPHTPVVTPVAGKCSAGLLGRDKAASLQRVHPLFPTADPARKQDHGRGEAWYLAYPGLRHPLA